MSKIILTQEFDSIEEREEFKIASKASEYKNALDDILDMLRRYDKYGHKFKSAQEAVKKIREEAIEIYNETLIME